MSPTSVEEEYQYLKRYAESHEGDCVVDLEVRILKALWMAYCIHANLDPGTNRYDKEIDSINKAVIAGHWYDGEKPHWRGYDDFYEDLSAYLW